MPISELLTSTLVASTVEAFEMMIGRSVELQPSGPEPPANWTRHVAATVAFGGHRRGVVCIHTSADAATEIAAGMLGIDRGEVNGEMPDAMGEVANLVAGSFWTKLAAVEPTTAITVPTVTVGSEFSTRHPSATARHVCPFKMGDELVLVELVLMGN